MTKSITFEDVKRIAQERAQELSAHIDPRGYNYFLAACNANEKDLRKDALDRHYFKSDIGEFFADILNAVELSERENDGLARAVAHYAIKAATEELTNALLIRFPELDAPPSYEVRDFATDVCYIYLAEQEGDDNGRR